MSPEGYRDSKTSQGQDPAGKSEPLTGQKVVKLLNRALSLCWGDDHWISGSPKRRVPEKHPKILVGIFKYYVHGGGANQKQPGLTNL